jgi:hypothetical protein
MLRMRFHLSCDYNGFPMTKIIQSHTGDLVIALAEATPTHIGTPHAGVRHWPSFPGNVRSLRVSYLSCRHPPMYLLSCEYSYNLVLYRVATQIARYQFWRNFTFYISERNVKTVSRGRFWSSDLWVMGPERFHCAMQLHITGWLKTSIECTPIWMFAYRPNTCCKL